MVLLGALMGLSVPALTVAPVQAAGFLKRIPSECVIDLGNAPRVEQGWIQQKLITLAENCETPALCPFRNISNIFFVQKIRGAKLRKACLLHVIHPKGSTSKKGSSNKGNVVVVYQNGTWNIVGTFQNGSGNFTYAFQAGSGNTVPVIQTGKNNTAGVAQFGNGNNLSLTQTGNGNTFLGVQTGGDSLSVTQNGGETAVSVQ